MKQQIRNQTFETNSSSVHSIAVFGSAKDYGIEELIPIMTENPAYPLTDAKDKLSYLYTTFLIHHKWFYIRELKDKYPNCIFEKPYWEDKYTSEGFYSDDYDIISFCELYNNNFENYFSDENLRRIYLLINNIVFNGEIVVGRDIDYLDYIQNKFTYTKEQAQKYLDENIEVIIDDAMIFNS